MFFAWPWYAFHWFVIAMVLIEYGEDMLPPKTNQDYMHLEQPWKDWYHELSIDTQVTMNAYIYEKVGTSRRGADIYQVQFDHFAEASFPFWHGRMMEMIINHSLQWLFQCVMYGFVDAMIIGVVALVLIATDQLSVGFAGWFNFQETESDIDNDNYYSKDDSSEDQAKRDYSKNKKDGWRNRRRRRYVNEDTS